LGDRQGVDKVIRSNLASLPVDAARDVPVRQKAFQDADDTLHIVDVVTNRAAARTPFRRRGQSRAHLKRVLRDAQDGTLRRTIKVKKAPPRAYEGENDKPPNLRTQTDWRCRARRQCLQHMDNDG